MNDFRNLKVWQKAIRLTTSIYRITRTFPEFEKFGLVSQMNRASISVSSNIAEGCGRQSKKDFKLFLSYALGSLYELESQLIVARNLAYISQEDLVKVLGDVHETQKMTYGLRSKL